jgi:hypothetical protein
VLLLSDEAKPRPNGGSTGQSQILEEQCCRIPAGTDNIPAELIRYGGRTLKKKMHKLMLNIWNNGRLPAQWNEGIICPIYKKGDRLNCSNYRPITLLNIAYKIFSILLNNKNNHTFSML